MWRKSGDDKPSNSPAEPPAPPVPPVAPAERAAAPAPLRVSGTQLGKSITVRGEISGKEAILLDGDFEGSIHVTGEDLTIGPNGRVRAEVDARQVTIEGQFDGQLRARERLVVRKTGRFTGEAAAPRMVIEEGAIFNGKVEMGQVADAPAKREPAAAAASSFAASSMAATKPVA
jgi:cytoskeletal protein CcmA (bactofilin family)